jgi:hypothetical protein
MPKFEVHLKKYVTTEHTYLQKAVVEVEADTPEIARELADPPTAKYGPEEDFGESDCTDVDYEIDEIYELEDA